VKTKSLRIGVLTGGGDVPGLNSCMRALTYRALEDGHSVIGIRRGWQGLVDLEVGKRESEAEHLVTMDRNLMRTVDRQGGTFLHTSRTNPLQIRRGKLPPHLAARHPGGAHGDVLDVTDDILATLRRSALDALISIGGDDTLSVSARLAEQGFPVIGVPKTMDNDVNGTDYCIGFSTAVTRSVNFINDLRTPAGSHERVAVIELFGRYCGETALMTGYLASADRTVIAEVPFDIEKLAALLVEDKMSNPSHYSILVISEGARMIGGEMVLGGETDAFGHKKLGGVGDVVGDEIKRITGHNVLVQRLAYLMRSGPPDSLDRLVAYNYGHLAYELVAAARFGEMVALVDGCYTSVPLRTATEGKRQVDVQSSYDSDSYRPKIKSVRGRPMFL
jgi:6-phosphofructokinase 1